MITKLFIVDDHYMVIEGIHALLQNEKNIEWIGHAMNADSCLAFLQHQQPDIILMDISLPDTSGIDLCKMVKTKYPAIHIVALSTFNQQSFIKKMMENGASGYLLKNASTKEILDCIETTMKGKSYFSFEAAQTLRYHSDDEIILTLREKEVLMLIAEGLTNPEIGQRLFISTATVDSHRKNILTKFNVKNTAALIHAAVKKGFL
ncbi:response regulator [Hydrotalea sandarakina]|uniref:LuxR family two component transcriptional regulator n=1 Tax=Hydrotalea sandarakina TaxID=1004304 RepID=A0A2W7RJ39_9BACT|nr:response regulator transcription factor [Hydrotalea sandarakina]PZX60878.1 LuxR family two component transcriptional regulator [Hydrotalea sandarakina]